MRKRKKAAGAMPFGILWRVTEEDCKRRGLSTDFKACIRAYARAIMPLPRSITGCRRSGLVPKGEQSPRHHVAFFFGRLFRLMALLRPRSLWARRAGLLRGCCLPFGQSANPHGAARPRSGGVSGFKSLTKGA